MLVVFVIVLTFKFSLFYSNYSDFLFQGDYSGEQQLGFGLGVPEHWLRFHQLLAVFENWRMGDHFVLLVNRLITESTLEAAIESRNLSMQATASDTKIDKSFQKLDFGDISTPRKLVECRICQDEDEDSNMETPCSCCGSLKVG